MTYSFDPEDYLLVVNGNRRHLPKLAWSLLQALHAGKGRMVSHGSIMDFLYGADPNGGPDDDSVIKTTMSLIRRALKGTPVTIQTQKGVGYRLVLP